MDNRSTEAPAQVTIGAKYIKNTIDTPFNKNFNKGKGGEIVDYEVNYDK